MRRVVRIFRALILVALSTPSSAFATDLGVFVVASGQGLYAEGPPSWLADGFGKLPAGGGTDGDADTAASLDFQAGVRLDLGKNWTIWSHVIARTESEISTGAAAGVTELWIESVRDAGGGRLRARAGTMFLPTSMENVDPLWSSPYTISLSAINSWIAEEVRPTGLDLDYRYEVRPGVQLRGGATAFVGNDTAGTLLGWRGWSIGNRLSVWNEDLPLPPLPSFATSFPSQKKATTPIGADLDDRAGWSARLRLDRSPGVVAQWTRFDNRGDRALYDGQYSWHTTFDLFGLGWQPLDSLTLAAEHIRGATGMGSAPSDRVDARFESTYALASWQLQLMRLSVRYDWFETSERDFSGAENNDERGGALALALVLETSAGWSFTVEFDDVDATRPSAETSLGTQRLDGRAVLARVRYTGLLD